MTEEEYKECAWIDTNMKFFTYNDFKKNAYFIKRLYNVLSHKIFYKWYVYANIHLTLKQKDIVWNYLNGDADYSQLDNF